MPPIRLIAEALPPAVPLTSGVKISGVIPYNTAHIVVLAKLIPTSIPIITIREGDETYTKARQRRPVSAVLSASDFFRPKGVSIIQAPRRAPGVPPIVKSKTSNITCHRSPPGEPPGASLIRFSNNFGRKTLNMVKPSDMSPQDAHTSTVVLRHVGVNSTATLCVHP